MPVTFWTFLIGSAALAGIPPFAGFWSKDEIISTAYHTGHYAIWAVALLTAILTAFYMARALLLTFYGEYRGHAAAGESAHDAHAAVPHESPAAMTFPLIVLAIGSVGAGFLNATALHIHLFTDWVHFGPVAESEPFNYGFAAISVVGAVAGLLAGYRLYSRWAERDPLRRLGPVYTLLERKYFLDDIYLGGIVRPIQYRVSAFANWTNQNILDGAVNGTAWLTRKLGLGVNQVYQKVIDGAVNGIGMATGLTGGLLKLLESGNVQRYAAYLFGGVAILAVTITLIR
jgi:NADH-quinone oxidoreductase subunit L